MATDGEPGSRVFTPADLDEWVAAGLIREDQAAAIRAHVAARAASLGPPPLDGLRPSEERREARDGLNLVSIAYYFGAFMILFAYTIFVGLAWEGLGDGGRIAIAAFTIAVLSAIGAGLRRKGYPTAGGLLLFAGAGVVPLLVYSIEVATGFWPSDDAGAYRDYYRDIAPSWVVMEVVAIAVCLALLRLTRFPLLILQAAFWGWFLSMDLTRLVARSDEWSWDEGEQVVSLVFGLALLELGIWCRRRRRDDAAFWLALSGQLVVFLHASALALGERALVGLPYLVFYLGYVVASVWLQSRVYLVFGALGGFGYVADLAFRVFEGALGFVFALALVGLAVVLGAVAFQQHLRPRLEATLGTMGAAQRQPGRSPAAGA